jgi:hypothetical protein
LIQLTIQTKRYNKDGVVREGQVWDTDMTFTSDAFVDFESGTTLRYKGQTVDAISSSIGTNATSISTLSSSIAVHSVSISTISSSVSTISSSINVATTSDDTTVTQQVTSLASTVLKSELDATLKGRTTNGYDANTKLLLYFEGADASTTFTDQTGKTVTPSGNAQIDTAQKRWGTSSGLFDGTGDYLTVTDANSDLDIGTSDFTIECWFRFNSVATAQCLIDFRHAEPEVAPSIWLDTAKITYYVNGVIRIQGTITLSPNVWYHIAISKSSGVAKLFINGNQDGASYTDANNYISVADINICRDYTSTNFVNGWLDELRISNSARYTTTFTPSGLNLLHTEPQRFSSVGKNLFDGRLVYGYYNLADGTFTASSDNVASNAQIRVKPSTTYRIKSTSDASYTYSIYEYGDGGYNSRIANNATQFTTSSSANYIKFHTTGTGQNNISSTIQVEEGSNITTYEAYTETSAIAPVTLRSVSDSIYDTFDGNTGLHTQNVAYDSDISSTDYDSYYTGYTNVDVVKTTAFSSAVAGTTGVDAKTRYIDKNNKELIEVSQANIDLTGSIGKYYYHTDKTIWIIVAKGAHANIAAARTALGTTKMVYQLATPVLTQYFPNALTAEPNGTIVVEPFISEVVAYGTASAAILTTTLPISSLVKVDKVTITNDGSAVLTPVSISSCTVAAGGLTYEISGAAENEIYKHGYTYVGLSNIPSMTYSLGESTKASIEGLMSQVSNLDEKIEALAAYVKTLT